MIDAPLTIGVLLPRSRSSPLLGANLLAGVQLALAQAEQRAGGRPLRLVVEEIGVGLAIAEQKTHKLLSADMVDLVVGLLPVNLAAALQPLFAAQELPLIAAEAGENIPRRDEIGPYLFHTSLALWQANYALGSWAATRIGRRAIVAQSFYDSGYDLPFAFRMGYEQAGGTVVHSFLTHRPPDPGTFGPIFEQVEREQPDLLFGSYSGRPAGDFVRAYAAAGLCGQIPLLGSGFLTDSRFMAAQGEAALGVITAMGWDEEAAPAGPFGAAFQAHAGRPADGFAALGYECARWACAAIDHLGGDLGQPELVAAALAAATIDGPRGRLQIDQGSGWATPAALTLREVRRLGDSVVQVPISSLPVVSLTDQAVDASRDGLRSGWFNPYLCV